MSHNSQLFCNFVTSLSKMKKLGLMTAVCMGISFSACDDGRLYEHHVAIPEEGRVVKLTGQLTGIDDWANGYNVVVAGFTDDSEYAVISKTVSANEEGKAEIVLSGINDEVQSVEFCVVNRLRKRILTFLKADLQTTDTIRMEVNQMNVGMYATIQEQLFNTTCISCHGASTFAAKGLYLTEEKSYGAMVNVPSAIRPDSMLVNPGDATTSVLYHALANDLDATLSRPHHEMISTQATNWPNIVRDWINKK